MTEPNKEEAEQEGGQSRKEGQLVVALLKAVAKLTHNASVQQAEKVVCDLDPPILIYQLSKIKKFVAHVRTPKILLLILKNG